MSVQSQTQEGLVELGNIPFQQYDRESYEKFGGTVDLTLDEGQLAAAENGLIQFGINDQIAAKEKEITFYSDDRGLY